MTFFRTFLPALLLMLGFQGLSQTNEVCEDNDCSPTLQSFTCSSRRRCLNE